MSPIQSLIVPFQGSPDCAALLQTALALAQPHQATVQAVYAQWPSYLLYPNAFSMNPELAPLLADEEQKRRQAAQALFDEQFTPATLGRAHAQWLEAAGEPARAFARLALCSDLMVLGQRPPRSAKDTALPADFVETVLLTSGKPALVVPYIVMARRAAQIGRIALVAWKESREAARALSAALPLLQRAEHVHVAAWGEEGLSAGWTTSPALDVLAYLRRHGIEATMHREGVVTRDVGGFLLSRAADLGADLLVMGCYGHGRAREWALGGASRTVLESMTLPVLMAH